MSWNCCYLLGGGGRYPLFQHPLYNKLPTSRRLAKRIEANPLVYYVLGTLLFKYVHQKSGEVEAVLCIPQSKIDFILDMYHGALIGGHQGMNKTLRTLSSRYYCPRLADYIRAYICYIRINPNTSKPKGIAFNA